MISLRCTVVGTDPERRVEVQVRAPDGATLAAAAAELTRVAGAQAPFSVAGVPLGPTARWGLEPLVDGAVLVSGAARRASPPPAGLLELHVVAGPDAGAVLALPPGSHTVGRGRGCDLPLADPDVSRRHCTVSVSPTGVSVHDLGSTNGTRLGGRPVPAAGVLIEPGARLDVGGCTLVLRAPGWAGGRAAVRPNGRGQIEVTRSPRARPELPSARVVLPTPPSTIEPAGLPWLTMVVPLAVAGPAAWLLRQPSYLLFGLLGPVMMVGTHLHDRVGRRRRRRADLQRHRAASERADRRRQDAQQTELVARRAAAGDPAELLVTARRRGGRLWERSAATSDLLQVALGRATVPSLVTLVEPAADGSHQPATMPLGDAPAVLDLATAGHLGLCGPPAQTGALARRLLGELVVRVSPQLLTVGAVRPHGSGPERAADPWAWLELLPHPRIDDSACMEHELQRRLADRQNSHDPPTGPAMVLLVDARGSRHVDPGLADVLARGASVGLHLVWLADGRADLPDGCGSVLQVRGPDDARWDGGPAPTVRPDGCSADWAEQLARALAPLRDVTPRSGRGVLPDAIGLLDVLDVDARDPGAVAARWRRAARCTEARFGVTADGVAAYDLAQDGPHALVAGTTGAGKSELLQSLVTSLAVVNRPDELSFVLVDYKGGAAFGACAGLPHVTGLVTDLDEHLAGRALRSLQAELTRRERLLAAAGAKDLSAYQRLRDDDPALAPMARLVLVVDEFRLLAAELPQFMDGIVRLAAIGRSLGVHLVLATQRPGGIVSADIRANVNLRICLRVRDRTDSVDVLDAPDAASLPQDRPGRALARTGAGPLAHFQVALAGGVPTAPAPDAVQLLPVGGPGPDQGCLDGGDLPAVLAALTAATASTGAVPPPSPWLPPLPDLLPLPDLSVRTAAPAGPGGTAVDALVLGLSDLPQQGRQPPWSWHPRRGSHLAVYGGSRSGRTSTLAALAVAVVESGDPSARLHVLDAAGGRLLALTQRCPAVDTALSDDEPDRVARWVVRLTEHVRGTPRSATQQAPVTLVLVDGWEALAQSLERIDHGRALDELLALIRDGEAAGLRWVVAGGRGVLTSRLAALVGERLLLRPADPTDLLLAGAPATPLRHQPPGRAVHVPGGVEVQLGWAGSDDQIRCRLAPAPAGDDGHLPDGGNPVRVRVRALPTVVHRSALIRTPDPAGPADPATRALGSVLLGVGGDDAALVLLDLRRSPLIAVCGPAGSGRSTTLVSVAEQLHEAGCSVLAVAGRSSPLGTGRWPLVPPELLIESVHSRLAGSTPVAVLVDDLDRCAPHDVLAEAALELHATHPGLPLLLATGPQHLDGGYRGVGAAVRRARCGVLLRPAQAGDGEPFGIRVPTGARSVPGRGLFIDQGVATALQVALPATPSRTPAPPAAPPPTASPRTR